MTKRELFDIKKLMLLKELQPQNGLFNANSFSLGRNKRISESEVCDRQDAALRPR